MNKDALVYGIAGLLVGGIITSFVASSAVNNNRTDVMRMMGMQTTPILPEGGMMGGMGMGSSMDEMMESMQGKTSDAFDAAFIEAMIVHHQGAINMAKEAKVSASHEELKRLADEIIAAQTKEIDRMRIWKKQWGY